MQFKSNNVEYVRWHLVSVYHKFGDVRCIVDSYVLYILWYIDNMYFDNVENILYLTIYFCVCSIFININTNWSVTRHWFAIIYYIYESNTTTIVDYGWDVCMFQTLKYIQWYSIFFFCEFVCCELYIIYLISTGFLFLIVFWCWFDFSTNNLNSKLASPLVIIGYQKCVIVINTFLVIFL